MSEFHQRSFVATRRVNRGDADLAEGLTRVPRGTQKTVRDNYRAWLARRGLPPSNNLWRRKSGYGVRQPSAALARGGAAPSRPSRSSVKSDSGSSPALRPSAASCSNSESQRTPSSC